MILTALANGLWQGAPIVAIACVLSSAVSKRNGATRYALWYATLVALAIVPVVTALPDARARLVASLLPHPAEVSYKISLIRAASFSHDAAAWFERLVPWLMAAWLAGVCVGIARLIASFARIHRIRRNAKPFAGEDGTILVSEEVAVPIVAGILTPSIVIPKALPAKLTAHDLRRIIQHERAHVKRNDALLNLIQRVIDVVLFFNPWVRLASVHTSEEREIACDDWVVEASGDAHGYAVCLATLAQIARRGPVPLLTPSALRSRHALVSRIERLGSSEPRRLTINAYAFGGTVLLFIVTALLLQAVAPAIALPTGSNAIGGAGAASVLASCASPNADAHVRDAVAPTLPHGLKVSGTVEVAVTIAPSGRAVSATVLRSSGNATIDKAVVNAARSSTYSPKLANCTPVEGHYLFRADFAPSP